MKKVITFLLVFLVTSPAFATALNFGFRIGGSDQKLKQSSAFTKHAESETDTMGSVFAGFKFGVFRAEAEYTYRFKGEFTDIGEVGMTSIMGNLYFQPPFRARYMPYFMGGAGMTLFSEDIGGQKDAFTWCVGGGIASEISRNLFLDWGYRYVRMEEIEDATTTYEPASHDFFVGLRFQF